jgi:multicomponent Na+:H+ antiporter subunit E
MKTVLKLIIRLPRLVVFMLFYLWELVVSNLRIAYDIITPRHRMRPGVVAVPLDARTDFEILAVVNLLSMTPGTLSLDVSTDRKVLYVHAMYLGDPDSLRREIKVNFEKRLLGVLR